jgi:pyruvate dehydrogenase E2 component (dihydrolipoamide acetyltransferase)
MTMLAPVKFEGIRGIIAQKMRESLTKTAQLSFFTDVDASALVTSRAGWKTKGVKIGYEDLIVKVLADLLPDWPMFNAVELAEGVVPQAEIHIGCAIALPGALVAPAIFNCQTLTIEQIADKRQDLVARAKTNKLSIAELTGATISVSNLGLTRVDHFTPILNYPQQAILGIGRIVDRPWVINKAIEVRPVMGLSLTVDHRVIDGAPAGEFLSAMAQALEMTA